MATLRQRETLAAFGFLAPAYLIYLLFLAIPLVASLLLLGLVGLTMASLSYAAALWLKSEDAMAPFLNMVAVPMLLLSGLLLPMSLGPDWLRAT